MFHKLLIISYQEDRDFRLSSLLANVFNGVNG